MKRLLTSAFFALTVLVASASTDDNAAKASEIARKMISQIELSEAQYIQIRQFTIDKLNAEAQIRSMYSNDKEMLEKKLNESENNYNFKLQAILNARQFNKYAVLKSGKKSDTELVAASKE